MTYFISQGQQPKQEEQGEEGNFYNYIYIYIYFIDPSSFITHFVGLSICPNYIFQIFKNN